VDEIELLLRLRERQARPERWDIREKQDVSLQRLRRVAAGKRPAPQQCRDFGRAPDHHHRLGAQHRLQPPPGAGDDCVHAIWRRLEQHVAARDEGADVGSAGAREGVAQRVLLHEAAAADIDGPQQRDVALAVSGAAPRARDA